MILFACLGALAVLIAPAAALADGDRVAFERVHERLADRLLDGAFGVPLVVEASVAKGDIRGDVYSVLDHPFDLISEVMTRPEAWCEMLTLHFNVKSCRRDESRSSVSNPVQLRIETARKYYVPPQGRTQKIYRLDLSRSRSDLLHVSLTADRGPFGVRDMRIEIFGMAVDDRRSFVHLRYGYSPGWFARAATSTFLATLGRRKVGFTVVGEKANGEPVYVKGALGAVERNALRYHLAIVAHLSVRRDAEAASPSELFEKRIERWFELTERYPRQLHEMSRGDYLGMKRREHEDQAGLPR